MAAKIPTATSAFDSILQSLAGGKKCSPEDLEALCITLEQAAAVSKLTEPGEFPENINQVFSRLESARKFLLEHPHVHPGTQNMVARYSIDILEDYCGLTLQTRYDRLELPVGNRRYTLPNPNIPSSHSAEFALGRARICTVCLPQIQGEAGCSVHASEMFCLLALAKKFRLTNPNDQSYPVGVVSLWNHSQLRILMAKIPTSFLGKLGNPNALGLQDGFKVELSPYVDPTDQGGWVKVKTLLHGVNGA